MLYTSAEAAKLLRKLSEEKSSLETQEAQASTFRAATTEKLEHARPEYSYVATRDAIDDIDARIRTVKHAINTFNLTHEVPGSGMTIDQVLVYLPQLTSKKQKLQMMKDRPAKLRETVRVAGVIEYTYTNYNIELVKRDYELVSYELASLQTALDVVNNSVKFDIDI